MKKLQHFGEESNKQGHQGNVVSSLGSLEGENKHGVSVERGNFCSFSGMVQPP